MRRALVVFAALCLVFAGVFAGCLSGGNGAASSPDGSVSLDGNFVVPSEDSGGGATNDGGGGGTDATLADAQGADAGTSDAGATDASLPPLDAGTAQLRLVNLVPDLGEAVNVCAAPHGAPLQGPFLKLGGVTAGLGYGQMTAYVTVPLVSYADIRIVAANAVDCSLPLVPDFDALPITVAQLATVALIGSAGDAGGHVPSLVAFADDPASGFPTYGARIRFVNAAPATATTDIVVGTGTYFEPEQTAVPYGAASSTATTAAGGFAPDPNGYVTEPMYTAQFNARQAGVDVASFAANSTASSGIFSNGILAFFTGLPGSSTSPLAWVLCDDTTAPAGYIWSCTTVSAPPSLTPFRLNHLAPSAPALDLCFQLADGTPTTTFGPLLRNAGVDGGVSFSQLTGDFGPVPTDTLFTMLYIPAGEDCAATPFTTTQVYFFSQPGVPDQAIELAQFGAGGAGTPYGVDNAYLPGAPFADGGAEITFAFQDFANEAASGSFYDLYTKDGTQAPVLTGEPLAASNIFNVPFSPGSYTMTIETIDGGVVTYSKAGIVLAAGDVWLMSYVDTSGDGGTTLVRCNLGQREAGVVTGCAE